MFNLFHQKKEFINLNGRICTYLKIQKLLRALPIHLKQKYAEEFKKIKEYIVGIQKKMNNPRIDTYEIDAKKMWTNGS